MATAPQAAMEMPQQGENPYNNPETMAVYDEMRKSVSSKEFGDELLLGASQSNPEEVAKFRAALEQIDLPPEALDQLNNMVDEILANPGNYDEIRAKYMEQGATDDILPEQFDAHFFTALNMAIDQMIAAPSGVQAFAKGGIAELTPVAKAIAGYGRNGDTMLAHITPAEARMLRRKGGSGTINPKTGLPEFFNLFKSIGKALKSVGNAVKSFVNSTVGKIVTTVALGFFLGPAAASFLGATSPAAIMAVQGFVGSAGSTLLAGGSLKDSLKAGAIGGLTAGAVSGISGAINGTNAFAAGFNTTPELAFQNQVDKFSNFVSGTTPTMPDVTTSLGREAAAGSTAAQPNDFAPQAAIDAQGPVANTAMAPASAPVAPPAAMPASPVIGGTTVPATAAEIASGFPVDNTAMGAIAPPFDPNAATTSGNALAPSVGSTQAALPSAASGNAIAPAIDPYSAETATRAADYGFKANPSGGSLFDQTKDFVSKNISPSGIQQEAAGDAIRTVQKTFPSATADQIMNAPAGSALAKAYSAAMPGMFGTYGPATALGIGAIGAFGGFSPKAAPVSPYQDLLTGGPGSARDLLNKNPGRYYVQDLPGVTYYNGSVIKPQGMADGGEVEPQHLASGGAINALFDIIFRRNPPPASTTPPPASTTPPPASTTPPPAVVVPGAARAVGSGRFAAPNTNISFASGTLPMGTSPNTGGITGLRLSPQQQPVYTPIAAAPRATPASQNLPELPKDLTTQRLLGAKQARALKDYQFAMNDKRAAFMNMGGIAGLAQGGYPRRTGQIQGPGTATSDSIPAMLSDGEFVMTAKAVRGAGKGDRRAGAKRMYSLMNQLEKNAARG